MNAEDYERSYLKQKIAGCIVFGIALLFMVLVIAFTKTTRLDMHIYIREICPVNNSVIEDGNGHFYDYIELYNPTDETIDLFGYMLSDSDDVLNKYKLPNDVIQAHEYKLIWIDEGLTGFSLRGGEKVFLSDETGVVIDRVGLPFIDADMVYKRDKESLKWKVAAAERRENRSVLNASGNVNYDIPKPSVSRQGGFYDEAFDLEIAAEDGYTIYYTLDGTPPSSKSIRYTQPIRIYDRSSEPNVYSAYKYISTLNTYVPDFPVNKATVLRAVSANDAGQVSDEICFTYFVGYNNKKGYDRLPTISMITDPDNLFSQWHGIYSVGQFWGNLKTINKYTESTLPVNYMQTGASWKRPALIEFFDAEGNVISHDTVSLGMHGNASLKYSQKSFNITGQDVLLADIFGYGEKKLTLRSGGSENTRSKIRDVLNQRLVEDRSVRTQHAIPCQMFIDGEYWGMYNIQENLDEGFISNYYGVDKDDLIILNRKKVVVGNEEDISYYNELLQYAESHNLGDKESYDRISQMMDIQSFIDYIATEEYIANSDSLQNNYSLWRTRSKQPGEYGDCKWRWIIIDTDQSVGLLDRNKPEINSFVYDEYTNGRLFEEHLFKELIKNEEFKRRFIVTFMDMANFNFEYGHVENEINKLVSSMDGSVVESHRRFVRKNYSSDDYNAEIDIIKDFYAKRYGYITDYLKDIFKLSGERYQLLLDLKDISDNRIAVNTSVLGSERGEITADYYSDYPVELTAMPVHSCEFAGWRIDGEMCYDAAISIELDHDTKISPVFKEVRP